MEQKLGWERPRYFLKTKESVAPPDSYQWYGSYGNKHIETRYEKELQKDCTYGYPPSHEIVSKLSIPSN